MFYKFIKVLCRILFAFTGGIEVFGGEDLPQKGPLIIVSNHQSILDPLVLVSRMPYRISFFAASYLFKIPVVGQILILSGAIPIHSEKGDFGSFKKALELLKRGAVIGIFPEGGVSLDGNLKPLMEGWAYLALKSGARVLPVIVKGTRQVLPVGRYLPHRGRIYLKIGHVMEFPEKSKVTREDMGALNEKMIKELTELSTRLHRVQVGLK